MAQSPQVSTSIRAITKIIFLMRNIAFKCCIKFKYVLIFCGLRMAGEAKCHHFFKYRDYLFSMKVPAKMENIVEKKISNFDLVEFA